MRAWSGAMVLGLLTAACVSQPAANSPRADLGPVGPGLVVERFLRAANLNDLETMASLFGTREGSVLNRDPRAEVEQRMFALASLLRHEDFSIVGEGVVPGRSQEATRIFVQLRIGDEQPRVPFTMVRSRQGGWLVEQIQMDEALRGRR